MARVQRVELDHGRSWTVVGADALPVRPAEEYLAFLRAQDRSPNTVKAYARGLAEWWTLLEATQTSWEHLPAGLFGQFLTYLRSGDLPGLDRIGPVPQRLAPASVSARSASVLAFYTYMANARQVQQPYRALYGATGRYTGSGGGYNRGGYVRLLAGIADRQPVRPLHQIRQPGPGRSPVLTPRQVRTILNGCATQDGAGGWQPNLPGLRDRLLFALLAESGMRVGEALSLRHCDVHAGAGGTPFVEVVPRQDHPHGLRQRGGRGRRIYVGDDLEALYSAYVWELVEAGIDLVVNDLPGHFVFVNVAAAPRFAPIRVETVYARTRSLTAKHPDLPPGWSPRWLRHTHATALLLAGRPPHLVMRRLGHLDIQTTLTTYGWVTEDAEMAALANWTSYVAGWKGLHDPS